jgi:hypothetical protein
LKFIHKVWNQERKDKLDFKLDHVFSSGVMLLLTLAGSGTSMSYWHIFTLRDLQHFSKQTKMQ